MFIVYPLKSYCDGRYIKCFIFHILHYKLGYIGSICKGPAGLESSQGLGIGIPSPFYFQFSYKTLLGGHFSEGKKSKKLQFCDNSEKLRT